MTIDLKTILILGAALLVTTRSSADTIPGTTASVDTLADVVEWDVSVDRTAPRQVPGAENDAWQFVSVEPYERTREGAIYLRFSLSVHRFEDEQDATDQFVAWTEEGDRPIGLTYAWVRIVQRRDTLYRLDMPCRFSAANVEKLAAHLVRILSTDETEPLRALCCRCGMPCMEGEVSVDGGFQQP